MIPPTKTPPPPRLELLVREGERAFALEGVPLPVLIEPAWTLRAHTPETVVFTCAFVARLAAPSQPSGGDKREMVFEVANAAARLQSLIRHGGEPLSEALRTELRRLARVLEQCAEDG